MNRFGVGLVTLLLLAGCSQQSQPGAADAQISKSGPRSEGVPAQQASGELKVSPAQAKTGQKVTLQFFLKDRTGKPITDASVKAMIVMTMGDSEMKDEAELKWDGTVYTGTIAPSMAGTWDVTVEARAGGKLLLSLPSEVDVQ